MISRTRNMTRSMPARFSSPTIWSGHAIASRKVCGNTRGPTCYKLPAPHRHRLQMHCKVKAPSYYTLTKSFNFANDSRIAACRGKNVANARVSRSSQNDFL